MAVITVAQFAAQLNRQPTALLEQLLSAGVTLFTTSASGPDYDLGALREWLA